MLIAIRSDCCKSKIDEEERTCSGCGKKAEPVITCEICMGVGKVKYFNYYWQEIAEVCNHCSGAGYFQTNWEEIGKIYAYKY